MRDLDETNLDILKLVLSNVKIKNQSNGMEMNYACC
jgi:transcription elongation factor GreA